MDISIILVSFRNILLKIAEFISKYIPFEAKNIYILLLLGLSILTATKIIDIVPKLRDSFAFWAILAGAVFYILGYL